MFSIRFTHLNYTEISDPVFLNDFMPSTALPSSNARASRDSIPAQRRWRALAVASALVVTAHLALLQSAPSALASMLRKNSPEENTAAVFNTRMLSPAPAPLPEPPAKPLRPRPSTRSAQTSESASNTVQNAVAEHAIVAEPAIDSIADLPPPLPQATVNDSVLLAAAGAIRPDLPAKAVAKAADAQELRTLVVPAPLRIKYEVKGEVKGFPYYANGELLWEHDGANYAARLEISHFILGSRTQTSKGVLTPQGIEPVRFGDKVRSEVAAHFERAKGKVSFSSNAPDVPLQPGAQDQLSLFMQIAAMMGGEPGRFTLGTQIPFQTIGPRSSEQWVFKVGEYETLKLVGTDMRTVKLTRDANGEYDPRGEVWLAPELGYLPVRIRLIQPNGDFVEQNMRSAQKP